MSPVFTASFLIAKLSCQRGTLGGFRNFASPYVLDVRTTGGRQLNNKDMSKKTSEMTLCFLMFFFNEGALLRFLEPRQSGHCEVNVLPSQHITRIGIAK